MSQTSSVATGLDHYLTALPSEVYEIATGDVIYEDELQAARESAEYQRQRADEAERREAALIGWLRQVQSTLKAATSALDDDEPCPF